MHVGWKTSKLLRGRGWSMLHLRARARARSMSKKLRKLALMLSAAMITFLVLQAPTPWGFVPSAGNNFDVSYEIIPLEFPSRTSRVLQQEFSNFRADQNWIGPNAWNTSSFKFSPIVSMWDQRDEQREQGEPRVLVVTGLGSEPCNRHDDEKLILKAAKNKLDYCRMHEFAMFYNMADFDIEFNRLGWAKLPLIRTLMLSHPGIQWIWWMESDAIFTQMSFVPEFQKYENYSLVLYGEDHLVYDLNDWKGLNTGNIILRNCQWSLDLIDAWGSIGPDSVSELSGRFLSQVIKGRKTTQPADDQSALLYLLTHETFRWASKVHFERSFGMTTNWKSVSAAEFEVKQSSLPGQGDYCWPFVTQFKDDICELWGTGKFTNKDNITWENCRYLRQILELAFDFADSQIMDRDYELNLDKVPTPDPILERPNFVPVAAVLDQLTTPDAVLDSSDSLLVGAGQEPVEADLEPDHNNPNVWHGFEPKVSNWDHQRELKRKDGYLSDRAILLVTGSPPIDELCHRSMEARTLVKALKNKMDYCRLKGIKFFYHLDDDSQGQWAKLPLLRMLMLRHPDLEWFWWVGPDGIFTDMAPELNFEEIDGYNLVLLTDGQLYNSSLLNAENFLIRNCQWSLDLLKEWARRGPIPQARSSLASDIKMQKSFTERKHIISGDFRSDLALMELVGPDIGQTTEEWRKWAVHRRFDTNYILCMRANCLWTYVQQSNYLGQLGHHSDSLPNATMPFMTFFKGCKPCSSSLDYVHCVDDMERALRLADNQVLKPYGLYHPDLDSSGVFRFELELENPTE